MSLYIVFKNVFLIVDFVPSLLIFAGRIKNKRFFKYIDNLSEFISRAGEFVRSEGYHNLNRNSILLCSIFELLARLKRKSLKL